MSLTPGEEDRLLLYTQAQLARDRRSRGLRLNVPEATAIIADTVCEGARDGLTLAAVRDSARTVLSADDVLPEVPSIVTEVRVEARFDDGTRLVVVDDPFGVGIRDAPSASSPTSTARITITNTAEVAIGVTSHMHLAEVNPRLRLDRAASFGMRLAIPTGDTVWLEPGATHECAIAPLRGERIVVGNTGVVDGALDDPAVRERALERLRSCGYLDIVEGRDVNAPAQADQAIERLVEDRNRS